MKNVLFFQRKNIAEILKDAPKGTKLYSPLFGEVELKLTLKTYTVTYLMHYSNESTKKKRKQSIYVICLM